MKIKFYFSDESSNRGNFKLLAQESSILQNHLLSASRNALYTSKSIQNKVIHIYASKIWEFLAKDVRDDYIP